MSVRVEHGDMREVLVRLKEEGLQFDSAVMDPPYHLTSIVKRFGGDNAAPAKSGKTGAYARASAGFMGKQWDGGDIAFDPETWRLVYDVLKPGSYLLAFGGTRTYHRMACAIEDAGFEVFDMIDWLYGSGFPKSRNIAKDFDRIAPDSGLGMKWDGYGTALKPAKEPICFARKPFKGTYAQNIAEHGVGALNINACRIESKGGAERNGEDSQDRRYTDKGSTNFAATPGPRGGDPKGRWPANVIHDGSEEVIAAFPDAPGMLASVRPDTGSGNKTNGIYGAFAANSSHDPRGDGGSAARFFYSAKATRADRLQSKHPTVKPVDLIRYLCRLITPPGGLILDAFAGSGTTGMAAIAEGFDAVLIEREAEYVADIRRRLDHVSGADTDLFAPLREDVPQSGIFGETGK